MQSVLLCGIHSSEGLNSSPRSLRTFVGLFASRFGSLLRMGTANDRRVFLRVSFFVDDEAKAGRRGKLGWTVTPGREATVEISQYTIIIETGKRPWDSSSPAFGELPPLGCGRTGTLNTPGVPLIGTYTAMEN